MTKLPSHHSMSGHDPHASKTPFKWANDGPLVVFFRCSCIKKTILYELNMLCICWLNGEGSSINYI